MAKQKKLEVPPFKWRGVEFKQWSGTSRMAMMECNVAILNTTLCIYLNVYSNSKVGNSFIAEYENFRSEFSDTAQGALENLVEKVLRMSRLFQAFNTDFPPEKS